MSEENTEEQTAIGEILAPESAEPPPQPRDEKGKFAPRQPDPAPRAGETGVKPEAAPPAPQNQMPPGYVPLAALIDTRQEAGELKRNLAEMKRRLEEATKPKQEPIGFLEDEDAAFKQRFDQMFGQHLAPFQQKLAATETALFEERLYRLAGGEKAAAIEQEISKAFAAGDPEIAVLSQALQTHGVAGVKALVEWYDRRTFDPAAKEAEIEARVLAKYGIDPGRQAQPKPAPVMPSNIAGARNVGSRAGPEWAGPTPIEDIFASRKK